MYKFVHTYILNCCYKTARKYHAVLRNHKKLSDTILKFSDVKIVCGSTTDKNG